MDPTYGPVPDANGDGLTIEHAVLIVVGAVAQRVRRQEKRDTA